METRHNFDTDLEYSMEESENDIFDSFYERVFPGVTSIRSINLQTPEHLALQKKGIDKIITLENGKKILVDEKKREKDWGDILLEEWSDLDRKTVGWTGCKNKIMDYVVYAIIPSKKIYLLPFDLLQMAWKENYLIWKQLFKTCHAHSERNGNRWTTSNLAIPTDVLLGSIRAQMDNDF